MEIKRIQENLKQLADKEYQKFHQSLCPTRYPILGVRIPVLRHFAKQLSKQIDFKVYWKEKEETYYEEIMLEGMLLTFVKLEWKEKLQYIRELVVKIDNWAICDTFCSGLKQDVRKQKEEFWNFLMEYTTCENEFELRFLLVCLMDYYLEKERLEKVFTIIEEIKKEDYYVKMAIAWLLSFAYIPFPKETQTYLERCSLDDFTYNKSIQKMIESNRISKQEKQQLRTRKRKINKGENDEVS